MKLYLKPKGLKYSASEHPREISLNPLNATSFKRAWSTAGIGPVSASGLSIDNVTNLGGWDAEH